MASFYVIPSEVEESLDHLEGTRFSSLGTVPTYYATNAKNDEVRMTNDEKRGTAT
jgi:hypothetical protein